jgi:hypothetical protein
MAQFIELLAVAQTHQPEIYIVDLLIDFDGDGTIERVQYGSHPDDHFGIATEVREAVTDWINHRKPVVPYVPPKVEQLRADMLPLTGRQLLRALFDIGITEDQIDAGLNGDPVALIEWKKAGSYERLHPLIIQMAASFNLPPEQVDSLWDYALTI